MSGSSPPVADTPAGDIEADDEVTWYVSGGTDINVGRRFAIALDATYMPYAPDHPPIVSVDMDPLT